MKNLPSYQEFLEENYLPYFGVKQALDDSKQSIANEEKISDFHRNYVMSHSWWNSWKKENEGKFKIQQDAFSKTYDVSKDGKVIFIYDYNRSILFTNEKPELFVIKNPITPEEYEDSKKTDVEDPNAPKDTEDKKDPLNSPKKSEKKEEE
jgi:hypothetical protein